MSQAKTMKLREYGTDILGHDTRVTNNSDGRQRVTATFQSSVLSSDPLDGIQAPLRAHQSRERIFSEKPLASKVMRASYQDSNIFGYKDNRDPTVQGQPQRPGSRMRNNPTFESRVFNQEPGPDAFEHPPSATRREEKWQSSVFDGPIQEKSKRKKLGQADAGVETLFGKDKVDLDNKSSSMHMLSAKKQNAKKWKPIRQEKTAEQRKNEELHGRSAIIYGTGKKGDGSLMANGADWRNLQQTHVNSPVKNGRPPTADGAKNKKYQNLQSNILANEDGSERPLFNPDAERAAMGTDSSWTAQAGSAKIINKGVKVDTYKKTQQQLSSQVFDMPDYSQHQPMKKNVLDVNNVTDKQRKQNHLYSDILGAEPSRVIRTPVLKKDIKQQMKKDSGYNVKDQKHSQLRSSLDTHTYEANLYPQSQLQTPEKPIVNIPGRKPMVTKIKELSSDILGSGSAIQKFNEVHETTIVDLDVKGLPENVKADDLKKLTGVKHVISATVDEDAIKNICLGTGRVKMRLTANEDLDTVKLQFLKAGYGVQDHSENTKKKSNFTMEQTLMNQNPTNTEGDAKVSKVANLRSSSPEAFGNTGAYQVRHSTNFDQNDLNQNKQATLNESLALSNWGKVGGKR